MIAKRTSDLCSEDCEQVKRRVGWPCANCGHFAGGGCCGAYKQPPLRWRLRAALLGAAIAKAEAE